MRITQAIGALAACAALAVPFVLSRAHASDPARALPAPLVDVPASSGSQTATFAGGCFWGVQGVFEHVRGVTRAVSGYAGGHVVGPGYEQVSGGDTGHAESVQVTFDPARVTYGRLLQIFFSVALDPTQVDRQGPDHGTQYRSEVFVADPQQERVAHAYVAQLEAAHVFARPVATRIDPAGPFYAAEAYHQDYLTQHPDNPYISINDIPKVRALESLFPESYQPAPVTVSKLAAAN